MDSQRSADLAANALRYAVAAHKRVKTILHSDRGSQFCSTDFTDELIKYGPLGPMRRVGLAGDNAAIALFFTLLQKNVLNKKRWETRDELRLEIIHWVEGTYHRRRREAALGDLTLIALETVQEHAATTA